MTNIEEIADKATVESFAKVVSYFMQKKGSIFIKPKERAHTMIEAKYLDMEKATVPEMSDWLILYWNAESFYWATHIEYGQTKEDALKSLHEYAHIYNKMDKNRVYIRRLEQLYNPPKPEPNQ